MHRHLVSIKVRIVRCTNQRMKLDGSTFDQYWLERLDTQSMQCRRTVQKNWMVCNNLFQNIPNLWLNLFHHSLSALDVMRSAVFHKLLHNKRLEQLQCHFLRKTTLVHFQFRTNNDNGSSGVVYSLTKKVLSETSLLTFQHIRKGF